MNDDNQNEILLDFNTVTQDSVYEFSQIFERDARRYNRAFMEQQEVSTK